MRTYWLRFETIYAQVMIESDGNLARGKSFEVGLGSQDRAAHQRALKTAWRHVAKLAKNYARRHNLTAVYTTHPRQAGAAWIVK